MSNFIIPQRLSFSQEQDFSKDGPRKVLRRQKPFVIVAPARFDTRSVSGRRSEMNSPAGELISLTLLDNKNIRRHHSTETTPSPPGPPLY